MVKYISFKFSQLRQKFQHKRNFILPDNDKNKFYTSKSKNFDLRYFSVFLYSNHNFGVSRCNLTNYKTPGWIEM